MHEQDKNNFYFLNREGRWPGFAWNGLELGDDGALRLSSVPLFTGNLPDAVKTAAAPDGPAGLAVDCDGIIYFSDPVNNRVLRIDGCDGTTAPVPCLGGSGSQITQFQSPRGLLIPRHRRCLFVADSGNHRIQVFDLATFQLVEIWGQTSPGSLPKPDSAPGQFNTPWALAGDGDGNVYVVDYGNQRVQKFNTVGDVVPSFWNNMLGSGLLQKPADIAVREQGGIIWIFVLDAASSTVFVFDADGMPVKDTQGNALVAPGPKPDQLMGLAVSGDALYVGDNTSRRILRFQIGTEITLAGEAIGYDGPIAALALDNKGGLLVHPGSVIGEITAPVLLETRSGFRGQGILWSEAIQVVDRKVVWHRLQALLEPLPEGSHLDLFAYATSKENDAPAIFADSNNPFSDPKWKQSVYAPNADITDLYIGGKNAKYLWIGALFFSDGLSTPSVSQLRVEFDYPTYDQYLPAIYRNQANCDEFLVRLLSLFASFNEEVEGEIAGLSALFDPKAAPKKFLGWLAGCLGLDLDDNWDEHKQRRVIAEIFRLSGRHGTASGLRESLRIFAGVDAIIEEPILHSSWWALPGTAESCCDSCAAHAASASAQSNANSILGWTTMLAPAQPQGAVVGTSADLDQSQLITDDDFGSPLFSDVAYRFMVNVYRSQVMCANSMARIQAVLDLEKPAHTVYELCVIDPLFRVGFQSRVGIDTVVAGPGRSLSLGSEQILGEQTVLAGEPASTVGVGTRLGMNTRLG